MKIEHIGFGVSNPIQMGNWYKEHLGFRVLKTAGDDADGVVFLIDSKDKTILEIGRLPDEPIMDFDSIKPIQLHIAIECENPKEEAERLLAAGAKFVGECPRNSYPGERVFIRDPWGMGIQLVSRRDKLV